MTGYSIYTSIYPLPIFVIFVDTETFSGHPTTFNIRPKKGVDIKDLLVQWSFKV